MKAHRFKHTPARSRVAKSMRPMSYKQAYRKAAGKPKASKPRSVPVKVVTKTKVVHKYRNRPPKPGRMHARAYHAGKAVGEAAAGLLHSKENY